jgi:hypothetical protein
MCLCCVISQLSNLKFRSAVRDVTEPYDHSSEWQVCLTNFGYAAQCTTDGNPHTLSLGEAAFRSPEMVSQHECSPKSDVWSASVALFALLSGGFYPFGAVAGPPLWERIVRGEWIRALSHGCSASAVRLLRSMMAADPSKRTSAADALKHALFEKGSALLTEGWAVSTGVRPLPSLNGALNSAALYDLFTKTIGATDDVAFSACVSCGFRKARAQCSVCVENGSASPISDALSTLPIRMAIDLSALRDDAEADTAQTETAAQGLFVEPCAALRSVALSELSSMRDDGKVWPMTGAVLSRLSAEERRLRVLIIEGGAGAGKSTALRYLESAIWGHFDVDGNRVVPLFVSLPKHARSDADAQRTMVHSVLAQRGINPQTMVCSIDSTHSSSMIIIELCH